MYFLGLSFRNATKASSFLLLVKLSHVSIWNWLQKYKPTKKYRKNKKIIHTLCSVVLVKSSNNNNATEEESPTMERQTKDNQEDENEEQDLDAYIKRLLTVQLIS